MEKPASNSTETETRRTSYKRLTRENTALLLVDHQAGLVVGS